MLTESQILRFSRHVLLREVGGAGQLAFLGACVRIPALNEGGRACALWLARAGIGSLILPDDRTPAPVLDPAGLLVLTDESRPLSLAVRDRLLDHWPELRFDGTPTFDAPEAATTVDGARAAISVLRHLLGSAGLRAPSAGLQ